MNTYIEGWVAGQLVEVQAPGGQALRALYRHPRAGDLWHAKLNAILTKLGFEKHEEWPSVCVLKASIAEEGMMCIILM